LSARGSHAAVTTLGAATTLAVATTLAAAALASGCASPSTPSPAGADVPRPQVTLAEADRTRPATCEESWVAASTGRVSTDRGEILTGAKVAYCTYGPDAAVCLPWVETGDGGWFSLHVDDRYRCMEKVSVRVIPPRDGERRLSDAYCAPTVTRATSGILELTSDLRVYTLAAPTLLPPRGDALAPRTVRFADGLSLTFAPDDLVESDLYEALSAGPVEDPARPCFLPEGLEMDGLYAFGPAMNVSLFAGRPKIAFTLPNARALPEGTRVTLYALGGTASQLDETRPLEEGAFLPIGHGRVASGLVVPDPGSELPVLTVVGYRRD